MPTSYHGHISKVIENVIRVEPSSILDVGVGFGKWGFLCREYLDIFKLRYSKADWVTKIDGVEVFKKYRNPVYDFVYDNVYYGDFRKLVHEVPAYDLIILGDVLEHFSKTEGTKLLDLCLRKAKFVIVVSPTKFFTQEIFDNPYEQHLSLWNIHDFDQYECEYEEILLTTFVALITAQKDLSIKFTPKKIQYLIYDRPILRNHPKLGMLIKAILMKTFYKSNSKMFSK